MTSAKENNYIEYISDTAIGYEIEQLAYEEDPLHIVKVLEKEGWLKVLNPHWTTAKVDTAQLGQLLKTRQQMKELGYAPGSRAGSNVFPYRPAQRQRHRGHAQAIPRKDLVESWRDLEDHAKELAKRLTGKEAATPSRTWKLLSRSAAGDDPVPGGDRAPAGGDAEDQEFLHQMAAGAAENSAS